MDAPLQTLTNQGSDQAVTLPDCRGDDKPEIPLAIVGAGCIQDTIALHIHHDGVDGAFVAARIHAHAAHNVAAGLGSLLDQGGADGSASESRKVQRSGVVN